MSAFLGRAAAITSIVVLAACSAQGEAPQKPTTLVDVVTVEKAPRAFKQVLTGSIQAKAQTPTAFLISGRMTALEAEVGQRVRKAEVLGRLSPAEQEADVRAAEAGVDAAQSRLAQTKTAYDRQNSLWGQGLTTRSALDGAKTAWDTASSTAESAEAQLKLAREALSYTELRSPADGVVIRKLANVDEVAQAGSPIYVIAEDGPRNALINVQEAAIAGWDMDRDVTVALVSSPENTTSGRVSEIAPALDATGTVPVKISVAADLPLGAPVTVQMTTAEAVRVALPAPALTLIDGAPAVWVVNSDKRVDRRAVQIDRYETGNALITEGLETGDVVVTAGTQFLAPGLVVETREVRP